MIFAQYILGGFFLLLALTSVLELPIFAAIYLVIGIAFMWRARRKKSPNKGSAAANSLSSEFLRSQAQRLSDLVNESLELVENSEVLATRISRLDFTKEKLQELRDLTSNNPDLKLIGLDEVEEKIKRFELDFESSGYREIASGNMQGEALEKEGKIQEAIEVYESLLESKADTPFTYRRLAILYKKMKQREDEVRVLKAALKNVPSNNNRHYQWFAERLAKLV